ncbi:Ctdspl2, partial [Symbiodinium necroappetens]
MHPKPLRCIKTVVVLERILEILELRLASRDILLTTARHHTSLFPMAAVAVRRPQDFPEAGRLAGLKSCASSSQGRMRRPRQVAPAGWTMCECEADKEWVLCDRVEAMAAEMAENLQKHLRTHKEMLVEDTDASCNQGPANNAAPDVPMIQMKKATGSDVEMQFEAEDAQDAHDPNETPENAFEEEAETLPTKRSDAKGAKEDPRDKKTRAERKAAWRAAQKALEGQQGQGDDGPEKGKARSSLSGALENLASCQEASAVLSSAEFTRSAGLGSVRFADRVKKLGTRVEMPRLRISDSISQPLKQHAMSLRKSSWTRSGLLRLGVEHMAELYWMESGSSNLGIPGQLRMPAALTHVHTPQKISYAQAFRFEQEEPCLVTPPKGTVSQGFRQPDQWRQHQAPLKEETRQCAAPMGRQSKAATCDQVEETLRDVRVLSSGGDTTGWAWQELPEQVRNALRFLRTLPALPHSVGTRPFLPATWPLEAKPTLVLDLDETLVHCCRGSSPVDIIRPPDLQVEFDDVVGSGRVYYRPFAQIFLEVISRTFEVVIFTASQQSYADQVIDALDPKRAFVAHRLYRQHCTEFHGAYFKELGLLGRSLSKCVLIDNSPVSVACNAENSVLIRSWYGGLADQELLALREVLEDMRHSSTRGIGFDRYLSRPQNLHDFLQVPLAVLLHDCLDWPGQAQAGAGQGAKGNVQGCARVGWVRLPVPNPSASRRFHFQGCWEQKRSSKGEKSSPLKEDEEALGGVDLEGDAEAASSIRVEFPSAEELLILDAGRHNSSKESKAQRKLERAEARKQVLPFLLQNGFHTVKSKRTFFWRSWYPLHTAVKHNDLETVRLLITAGADPQKLNSRGETPEQLAERLNRSGSHADIVDALHHAKGKRKKSSKQPPDAESSMKGKASMASTASSLEITPRDQAAEGMRARALDGEPRSDAEKGLAGSALREPARAGTCCKRRLTHFFAFLMVSSACSVILLYCSSLSTLPQSSFPVSLGSLNLRPFHWTLPTVSSDGYQSPSGAFSCERATSGFAASLVAIRPEGPVLEAGWPVPLNNWWGCFLVRKEIRLAARRHHSTQEPLGSWSTLATATLPRSYCSPEIAATGSTSPDLKAPSQCPQQLLSSLSHAGSKQLSLRSCNATSPMISYERNLLVAGQCTLNGTTAIAVWGPEELITLKPAPEAVLPVQAQVMNKNERLDFEAAVESISRSLAARGDMVLTSVKTERLSDGDTDWEMLDCSDSEKEMAQAFESVSGPCAQGLNAGEAEVNKLLLTARTIFEGPGSIERSESDDIVPKDDDAEEVEDEEDYGVVFTKGTNVFDIDPPRRDGAVADFSGLVIRGMSGGPIVVVEGSTDNPVITDQVVGLTFARTDGNTGWAMLLDASHVEAALD